MGGDERLKLTGPVETLELDREGATLHNLPFGHSRGLRKVQNALCALLSSVF